MAGLAEMEILEARLKYLEEQFFTARQRLDESVQMLKGKVKYHDSEFERINAIMEAAITTAVHELIQYLKQADIQSLDEQEFSEAVKKLIWDADPNSYFPF